MDTRRTGEQPTAHFEEVMTVNRILQQYPRTRPIFEHLFVNIPVEGCDCLDEVAWRHGLDVGELLAKLEDAIGEAPRTAGCHRG